MAKVPWNKNKNWPKTVKERISVGRKGIPAWNKGKEWPEDVKKKISESRKGKPSWNKNRTWPKSVKDKIRRTKLAISLGVIPESIKSSRKGSKRLRFEILKRDKFTCRYCGRSPLQGDKVILEVDHVNPDGPTSSNNLITACKDCNSGKSNIKLTSDKI